MAVTAASLLLAAIGATSLFIWWRWSQAPPSPIAVTLPPVVDLLADLPPWLQDYVLWHRQPAAPDDKYVVWICDSGGSGGIGDRVRGLVSAFYLAVALGRRFRIVNTFPIDLWHVLQPAHLDWLTDSADVAAVAHTRFTWVCAINDDELFGMARGRYDRDQVLVLETNCVFWDVIMNGPEFVPCLDRVKIPSGEWKHGRRELLFAWAWAVLFQPSEALRDELHQLRARVGLPADQPYVAVHIRRGGHWTDDVRHADLQPFVDCLRNVTDVVGALPVYVATDDAPTRVEFASRAAPLSVQHDDAEPFHVAQSRTRHVARLNLRTWAEFFLLMQSKCLVASRSGFSEWPVAASRDARHGARCQARFDRCAVEMVRRSLDEIVPLYEHWPTGHD